MSTLIVEVCRIDRVLPHANADALELARIKGWQCVIPKGRYVGGDLVTYIPIDSVIPVEHSDRWASPSTCRTDAFAAPSCAESRRSE